MLTGLIFCGLDKICCFKPISHVHVHFALHVHAFSFSLAFSPGSPEFNPSAVFVDSLRPVEVLTCYFHFVISF